MSGDGAEARLQPRLDAISLGEVLRRSTEHLAAKGSETPRLDAERLLAKATGLERIELYMSSRPPADAARSSTPRGSSSRAVRGASRCSTCSASGGSGG